MAEGIQHLWPRRLPRELSEYILALAQPQDVACNLRLSCKEAAHQFCNTDARKTASLSEAVPVHLFAPCWGTPAAVHRLPVARRKRLLAMTAGTGVTDNVKRLIEDAGLPASAESMAAAAAAGDLQTCQLLHGYGCPWRDPPGAEEPSIVDSMTDILHTIRYSEDDAQGYPAMRAAAQGGHLDLCQWLRGAGCPATPAQILRWGARGGHRPIVEWVLSLGFSWQPQQPHHEQQQAAGPAQDPDDDLDGLHKDTPSAGFHDAILGGHRHLCEYMLQRGCKYLPIGPAVALAGGHTELHDWLMQVHAENPETCRVDWASIPGAAALGADLATLQREVARLDEMIGPTWRAEKMGTLVGMQAACSETPDAADKLRWLYYTAGVLRPGMSHMCVMGTVGRTEMVEALVEVLGREEGRACEEATAAAAALPQVQVQGEAEQQQQQQRLVAGVVRKYRNIYNRFGLMAAASGHVGALEVLERVRGWRLGSAHAALVAYGGNPRAVAWVMQRMGPSVAGSATMVDFAALAGNTPLVRKLAEAGYALSAEVLAAAAKTGNGELVEWLVQRGCPQGEPGDPYVHAAHSGDLPTLELLRRLGCPLPPPGSTEPFTRAVYGSSRGIMDTKPGQASEPALEWLLDAGFPVDWGEALEAAAERDDEQDATRVCAWLAAQQEEREGRGEWKERRAERGREREEAGGEGEEREGEGLRRVRARR